MSDSDSDSGDAARLSYITSVIAVHQDDPPPSYDSIFGQVRSARKESSNICEFINLFLSIISRTVGFTIVVALVLAIPISMIAIGSMYLRQCPRERYIPIYLIVAGVFGVLRNLSSIVQSVKSRSDGVDDDKTNSGDTLVSCFLLAWFIAGNVWIYRVYNDFNSDDPSRTDYCHPTLYWFAFWMTTATYIFGLTICGCFCCTGLIASCCARNST